MEMRGGGREEGMVQSCNGCKYSEICKVPDEKRLGCKGYTLDDGRIFGLTWEEIQRMQAGKKRRVK